MKTILKKIKENIIIILDFFGYRLVKNMNYEPIDLRYLSNNPRALPYFSSADRQVLIDVEFEKGRGLEVFSLSPESVHPFIVAIKYALDCGDYKNSLKEKMSQYYNMVQPDSASSWLGLDEGEVLALDGEPAWLSLLPWEDNTIHEKRTGRKECAIYDNKEQGENLTIDQGWRNFGPVADSILNLEVNRLYLLMLSIKKNGILRSDTKGGDIGGIILIKEADDFRWLVEWGGQHRAAAISAMGYKKIAIRVWQVVDRNDVDLWPSVQSGVYSKIAALKVFDLIYDGEAASKELLDWAEHE